ncbi:MAG: penicillin-binding protein 2 [Candidatus Binatia bacterium]
MAAREPRFRVPGAEIEPAAREVPTELFVRIGMAAAIVLVAFGLLGLRLWYLQVVHGPEMRALSENNRIRLVRTPAARGIVYDRNGEILIDNRASFDIVFVPEDARNRTAVLANLATYVGEPEVELVKALHAPSKRPPYEGIVLRRDVEWQTVVALETHQLDLPGVTLRVGPRRYYPLGPIAAHLLGYVGEVSEHELGSWAEEAGYVRGDMVGKAGLERALDIELRGAAGGQQVEVDALGRRVRALGGQPDVPGNNLTLTLDRDLQETAERALGEYDGAVVALDPRNGEVLVMVSKPAFDPNLFARGIRRGEWASLVKDKKHPLNNRTIQGTFPPGSTFKIAMSVAALETGAFKPSTGVSCGGGMQFGSHYFHCWKKGGHGGIAFHEAIVQSCDVYFYQVGQKLGIDRMAEWANKLGLGLATGIRLDHENPGTIPSTEWKRKRFGQPWFAGETLSCAIGQGYVTATPLQMAQLAAMIANGGIRYRPQYVKRVEAPDGALREEVVPEVLEDAHIHPDTLQRVRAAMRDVVEGERGTGRRARVAGIEVAGKTGTAQAIGTSDEGHRDARTKKDHAWFIAFAPVDDPRIAVAVLAEHSGEHGGTAAAPIAQQVIERYVHRDALPGPPAPPTQEVHALR